MIAIIKPNYVNHEPVVLGNGTTFAEIIDNINQAEITNEYAAHIGFDEMGRGLREYRLELALDYLSRIHHSANFSKGQITSALEAYILGFSVENTDNGNIARRLITRDQFKFDNNLKQLIEKIDYASKNIFYKYLYNLKKEASGISPGLFLSGIGMLFSGYVIFSRAELIEEESIASAQQDTAITQISVGAALTVTPFIKAAIKTVVK